MPISLKKNINIYIYKLLNYIKFIIIFLQNSDIFQLFFIICIIFFFTKNKFILINLIFNFIINYINISKIIIFFSKIFFLK